MGYREYIENYIFGLKHTHPLGIILSQRNAIIALNSMVYIRFSDRTVVSGKLVG